MTRLTFLTLCALCLTLASCSKHDSNPGTTTTTTTSTGTLSINCYPVFNGLQTEVIVSEPGGAILLDTTLNKTGAPLIASLKTNDTLVDVTQVSPVANLPTTDVYTFKSVNLARISTLGVGDYGNRYKRQATSTQAQIFYYNIPSQIDLNFQDGIYWSNYVLSGKTGATADPTNRTLQVGFDNYQGDYSYLLFPNTGLYSLHKQKNAIDSIDCSHLDTAVQLTFSRPVPFTAPNYGIALYGLLDTTDLTKVISFADWEQISSKPGVDFEYAPTSLVQKYEMWYTATESNNDQIFYYSLSKILPQSLPLPQGNDFSTSSTKADNFSVTFPNKNFSYYELSLSADTTIRYKVYISPDSSTVHPVTFLTGLKSKLLQNARVSSLQLNSFNMTNFSGLNYLNFYRAGAGTSVSSITRNY